ncbi:hypothetical protein E5198_15980 [Pseudomonas sp. A-1]|uniref:hypothetical protein n=1 Tax=Pseudomonas sp. A-1 TaxID=1821274 RepID=UPI0010A5FCB8|nr:hypothetical protein [Pseudomonas sp. A-1]THG78250.1 hypothetical protein E5198_15980 [Pseudomonas sp. A-1]
MKAVSLRVGAQRSAGSEFLDTCFGGKALRITVTSNPDQLVADRALPAGDDVQVARLDNPYRLTRDLTNILGSAKSGDALVLVCCEGKLYRATLKYLGLV